MNGQNNTIIDKLALQQKQAKSFCEFVKHKGTIVSLQKYVDDLNELIEKNNEAVSNFVDHFEKFLVLSDQVRINKNILYFASRQNTMILTPEQKQGVKQMILFLFDKTKKIFGFYGYAGTGKTSVLIYLVAYLLINGYVKTVVLTAPTNKAVNVMKSKFRPYLQLLTDKYAKQSGELSFEDTTEKLEELGIKVHFMTTHKLLMFQTEFSVTGETIFVRNTKVGSLIPNYEVVVIDESSMIGIDLADTIFDEIQKAENKTKRLPKLIFSGDPAQLPPVSEDTSLFFADEPNFDAYVKSIYAKVSHVVRSDMRAFLEKRYKHMQNELANMEKFLLTTVVRSKICNVTQLCALFRAWVSSPSLPNIPDYLRTKGVTLYDISLSSTKIDSVWFKTFLQYIAKDPRTIIVTWTNKQCEQYNNIIRSLLFGASAKKFEIGDILMLTDFYSLDRGENFIAQKLYTSEQIKVTQVSASLVPINCFENLHIKNKAIAKAYTPDVAQLIAGLNAIYCSATNFHCWINRVCKIGEDTKHMSVIVIDNADIDRYIDIKNRTNGIISAFLKQHSTKEKNSEAFELHIARPLWKQWHKIFVEPFACVNYGYSITCHKAQGSNFYNVFVDLDDILQNTHATEAKKCAYTAVTRACNELHILI